jgi:hypothetical protein
VIIQWPATPPASAAIAQTPQERRDLLVTRAGTVRLPVTCTRTSGRCRGVAYVRATDSRRVLARGRYSVRAGRETTVLARLTPAGHAALRRSMIVPGRLHAGAGVRSTSDGRVNLHGRRAPAAAIRTTRATATADGRVRVRVSCPKTAHAGCRGRLRLHDLDDPHSSSAPLRIRAGRTATVGVRLTAPARRALARNGRLEIQASTVTRLPTGVPNRRIHDIRITRAR